MKYMPILFIMVALCLILSCNKEVRMDNCEIYYSGRDSNLDPSKEYMAFMYGGKKYLDTFNKRFIHNLSFAIDSIHIKNDLIYYHPGCVDSIWVDIYKEKFIVISEIDDFLARYVNSQPDMRRDRIRIIPLENHNTAYKVDIDSGYICEIDIDERIIYYLSADSTIEEKKLERVELDDPYPLE